MHKSQITKPWIGAFLAIGLLSLVLVSFANAQTAGYTLARWSVNSGGGSANGGEYRLSGVIGQTGVGESTGSGYAMRGGFGGVAPGQTTARRVYLPLIVR